MIVLLSTKKYGIEEKWEEYDYYVAVFDEKYLWYTEGNKNSILGFIPQPVSIVLLDDKYIYRLEGYKDFNEASKNYREWHNYCSSAKATDSRLSGAIRTYSGYVGNYGYVSLGESIGALNLRDKTVFLLKKDMDRSKEYDGKFVGYYTYLNEKL